MIGAEKKCPVQTNIVLRRHKNDGPRCENGAAMGIAVSQMTRPLQNANSISDWPIFGFLCDIYDGCDDLIH